MDGLALFTTTTTATSFQFPSVRDTMTWNGRRELGFRKRSKFVVLASSEDSKDPKLDPLDQMELRFGRLLGEDPKLTLAKIMARKTNPDASYIEVEKSFYKNKGKIVEAEELPFDVSDVKTPSISSNGLNLARPVPKKVVSFNAESKPVAQEMKKPRQPVGKGEENNTRHTVPNVILRKKPSMYAQDDVEDRPLQSRMRIKPNLILKMRSDQTKEKFSDMTLLRKPEQLSAEKKQDSSEDSKDKARSNSNQIGSKEQGERKGQYTGFTLLNKPETAQVNVEESSEAGDVSVEGELYNDSIPGMQPLKKSNIKSTEEETAENDQSGVNLADSTTRFSVEAALHGKPKRLEKSPKETSKSNNRIEDTAFVNPGSYVDANEPIDIPSSSPQEDADWQSAEGLLKTGNREEVEIISSSTRGFVVSFGSLVGFLPYRNLAAKWKFLAFESWLRQKGLDPSMYRQNLGIVGSYDVSDKDYSLDSSINQKKEGEISPHMKLEDLLRIYDQEKLNFLSSFVGQKIRVNVVLADRKMRKLVFSLRPKEKEELVEKKRNLVGKLQVGDVVKCCITKITYFGVFVEVEGVPALIHQTEVSWDATLDPASYFKVGQIVEAKVHQLDYTLERIFLSLKEIVPDPLIEALESVVGDRSPLDGRLQAAQADAEWADVESLVKELQKVEGIQSVSKGRFFLSPGLAPTFQVYMASMFENQYKLLARSGNKVQELIVQANLDKEQMKSTILSCTNRVE